MQIVQAGFPVLQLLQKPLHSVWWPSPVIEGSSTRCLVQRCFAAVAVVLHNVCDSCMLELKVCATCLRIT